MFANLNGLEPDPAIGLLCHKAGEVVEHEARGGLAAYCGKHPQRDKSVAFEFLEMVQSGIINRDDNRVIEYIVQPRSYGLETAKVEAPVSLIKMRAGE